MRPVTCYQADDGSLWATPEAALDREEQVRKVQELYRELGMEARPEGEHSFLEGLRSVQQPRGTRERLQEWVRENASDAVFVGPVADAARRWMCIDLEDREWAEPFMARRAGEARHVVG